MAFEKNLDKMGKLLSILDEEHLSKNDFVEAFSQVLKFAKAAATQNREQIAEQGKQMQEKLQQLQRDVVADLTKTKSELSAEEQRVKKDIESRFAKYDADIQQRLANLKDGESPEVEAIIEELKQYIPEPLEELPVEQQRTYTRDLLEGIQEEEEKLAISAIAHLEERLDELFKRPVGTGGGGFNYGALEIHIIDDENISGTINGVNQTFTINHAPSPVSSLKVYRGGARQRITEDYTLSGSTITFTIAPQVGEILLADYRI